MDDTPHEELAEARAALLDQRRQLQLALEAARMGTWDWDVRTGRISWSPSLEQLHGFAPGEFGGTYAEFAALIHPEDQPHTQAAIERALSTGEPYRAEFRIIWRDGTQRWMAGQGQAFYDEAGAPTHMLGIGMDITEHRLADEERARLLADERRARQEAEAAHKRLAFLIGATSALASSLDYATTLAHVVDLAVEHLADWCSLFVLDARGEGQWVGARTRDPARQQYLNELHASYPPHQLPSTTVSRVLRTGQTVLLPSVDDAALQAVSIDARHLELFRAVGPTSYLAVPLRLQERVLGVLVLASTSQERRLEEPDVQLAEELARRAVVAIEHARLYGAEQRARAEAEAAVRARDVFFSVAAHELRTPLTALLGQAQLLQRRSAREGHLSERDTRTVETIAAQALRLNKLVLAMLDIARLEQGRLQIERAPLDLAALVARVVAEVQPTLDRHTLVAHTPPGALEIAGDALRLEQVVQNLIDNAVKYSPTGGEVRVTVERAGEEAVITVADQGIGIPADALPRLFQRFYRADNVDERRISGMGIGLFVVREIASLHGGSASATSELGRGSSFTVHLPLGPPC